MREQGSETHKGTLRARDDVDCEINAVRADGVGKG